jgi:hypothetical protein
MGVNIVDVGVSTVRSLCLRGALQLATRAEFRDPDANSYSVDPG